MTEDFKLKPTKSQSFTIEVTAEQAPYLGAYHAERDPDGDLTLGEFILRECLRASMSQRANRLVTDERTSKALDSRAYGTAINKDCEAELARIKPTREGES